MRKDAPEFWMPTAWPLFWRRAFLITFPISGPIWFALVVACGTVAMALVICIGLPVAALFMLKETLWDDPVPPSSSRER